MSGKNIVLIGMPGSGKTTLGKHLEKQLGIPFIDTDIIIEQTTGKTISNIFADLGEDGFRLVERETIKKAAGIRSIIIATGGGAWAHSFNRKSLSDNGEIVYLSCPLQELWNRLEENPAARPLLTEGFESLERLYHKRHSQYKRADYIIDTSGKSVQETGDELTGILGLKSNQENAEIHLYTRRVSFRDRNCDIVIGSGALKRLGSFLDERFLTGGIRPKLLLVTNPFVNAMCGDYLTQYLRGMGFTLSQFIVPEGETYKSLEWAHKIYTHLAGFGFDRGDVVVALGGGVTGDLAGFAAATYMRGMPLVQLPTTLLAQVDSSIGGKTAVNLPEGKNLVGAFHQSDLVLSDTGLLKHLSQHDFRQGLAECIKYGIIDDSGLFGFFEKNLPAIIKREPEILNIMVGRCCDIKTGIVQKDEKEQGMRMLLNLGHTVGHALEAAAGYGSLGHGDAVALGIRAKAYVGLKLGLLSQRDFDRIMGLLDGFGFPSEGKFSLTEVMEYMGRDKKKKRGKFWLVMPKGIGDAEITSDIAREQLREGLKFIGCK